MLKVNEIFKTIQGETRYAGLPCVFIRLAQCNLRCSYCDTTYAYNDFFEISVDDIIKKVKGFNCNLVTITGGEPLLQSQVFDLINKLNQNKFNLLLETNGSLLIKDINQNVCVVMDIKGPSSNEHKSFLIENLNYIKQTDEIKFVIADKRDYDFAKAIIEKYNLCEKTNVLMSPNVKELKPKVLAEWILEDDLDVRFQIQLHKVIGVR
jgi:7-carboxy-7-deazaguanine synthase